jgi:hypothetical protein
MAVGTKTDFIIYPEQFWGGAVETLQQNAEVFNENSVGAMRMVTLAHLGDYNKESFLKSTAGLVARRDVTSTAGVTAAKLVAGELVGVKMNRRLGPVDQTRDAFRKIGVDPKEFSMMLGAQAGVAIAVDYCDVAIKAVRAAISQQGTALQYNATADTLKTANHTALVGGLALFGDRSNRIIAFVMHSKPYFDLVKQSIADKITNVADVVIYSGTPATLGKPTLVTDSASLVTLVAGSPTQTTYDILGLSEGAVEVHESEERDILSQPQTGLENLVDRIQGEYAFNLKIKGCAYDTAQGANPTDTIVSTNATWIKQVADQKEMPGVRITVN